MATCGEGPSRSTARADPSPRPRAGGVVARLGRATSRRRRRRRGTRRRPRRRGVGLSRVRAGQEVPRRRRRRGDGLAVDDVGVAALPREAAAGARGADEVRQRRGRRRVTLLRRVLDGGPLVGILRRVPPVVGARPRLVAAAAVVRGHDVDAALARGPLQRAPVGRRRRARVPARRLGLGARRGRADPARGRGLVVVGGEEVHEVEAVERLAEVEAQELARGPAREAHRARLVDGDRRRRAREDGAVHG
mmetsp:Transcript_11475/g.37598  ORF Transcript_11475/g.37598 Transcript_11475/m.37598 type:complete len:249 (-) Transcript_11475:364-1110(-)